ncbi:MAG: STAS domain-containing protein [Spirochaetota bacterium]
MAHTSFSAQSNPPTLAVVDELSYADAGELRDALVEALDQVNEALHIDLSGVSSFDLAGVQLLYASKRSAAERGVTLSVGYGDNKKRFEKFYRFTGLAPIDIPAESKNNDAQ